MIEATQHYYSLSAGTVHRSQYLAARKLTERYEQARSQVARLLNAPHAHNIIWTRGTTEAINRWRKARCVRCYSRAMKFW